MRRTIHVWFLQKSNIRESTMSLIAITETPIDEQTDGRTDIGIAVKYRTIFFSLLSSNSQQLRYMDHVYVVHPSSIYAPIHRLNATIECEPMKQHQRSRPPSPKHPPTDNFYPTSIGFLHNLQQSVFAIRVIRYTMKLQRHKEERTASIPSHLI